MSGGNGMPKRKNRFYKWVATLLTVALLAGQSSVSVLAQEDTAPLENEISDEDTVGADDAESDGDTDNSGVENGDTGSNGEENEDTDNSGGENGDTDSRDEENGDTDSRGEENDGTDNNGDDNDSGSNDEENVDMDNSDANVEEEAESPAEMPGEETVSGNGDGLGEPGSNVLAEGDYDYSYSFEVDHIRYRITGDDEVTVAFQEGKVSGDVTIPANVENAGETYRVTSIYSQAFANCGGLTGIKISDGVTDIEELAFASCAQLRSVEIPDSVTNIGRGAFIYCTSLEHIEIPDKVTRIESSVFSECSGLKSVKIPSGVTSIKTCAFDACTSLSSIETLEGVTSIEEYAFRDCSSLSNIKTLKNVTNIEEYAFLDCSSLSSIENLENVANIGAGAFYGCSSLGSIRISNSTGILYSAFWGCSSLRRLYIVVPLNALVTVPDVYSSSTFWELPSDRSIVFLAEDGTELTGEAFETARDAFLKAGKNDDFPNDNRWWGWKIKDPSAPDTYQVTIAVRKDNGEWMGHNRTFVLTKDNGATFVKDLNAVEAGTYSIYDVTGLAEEAYQTVGMDTGVTVGDTNKSATVDYYTVTFCDDDGTPYADTTEQKSQIILKTVGRVSKPQKDPTKAGYTFDEWVKEDKNTEFSFATTAITAPTKIYAKWTKNTEPTYEVTIRVKKDGQDWVNHNRTFALREDGGAKFLTDLTQVPNGTYSIYDMTGINPDSYWSKAVDTGRDVTVNGVDTNVDVTVQGANAEKEINYYTVTFYDGAADYPAGTPQEPQVVLRGYFAEEPERPQKAGYRFTGWRTEDGGSTAFDFSRAVNGTTGVYASWEDDPTPVTTYTITATAGTGGSISPSGTVSVNQGESQSFRITANTGCHIKSVTVDDVDVTTAVTEAEGGYTFTNVNENHTIAALFESDGNKPAGEKKPEKKPRDRKPEDGESSGGGNETGDTQTVAIVQTAAPSAVNNVTSPTPENTASEKEPKTGDASPVEIYATVAMIAGLTYLLLYFMEESRGMTEREKEAFVAAFIRWAKKGGRFRRCCALAAIFCLLVYYHSIGKRVGKKINREYLKQVV